MRIWLRFWIFWAVATFAIWLHQPARAQTATSNLINPAGTAWGIPSSQVLNSGGIAAVEGGGVYVPGSPYYNSDTNTIRFSYLPGTVAQSIAINSALAGTGIKWVGYDYSWEIQNASGQSGGTLFSTITLNGSGGKALESYTYNYPQGITPASSWLLDSGRKLFSQSGGYTTGQVSSLDVTWTGNDSLFWMGLYGPRVRNTDVRLLYDVDQCSINPISDPSCPGYQTAMCTANPLFSASCPGYAQAFLTQQCSISALYDPSCPGYQQAYFTQQCTANPLYDRACPGYNTAYVTQQNTQAASTTTTTTSTTTTSSVALTGTVSTTEPTLTIATDGSVSTGVAVVPDSQVNTVVTKKVETTASPTGTLSIQIQTKPSAESDQQKKGREATAAERELAMKEEKKREEEASDRRKQLAERQRRAAMENAVARGREAIREADSAKTLDEQMANQSYVVATMSFVPGFEAYGQVRLPDAQFYAPREIYRGQQNVDNRRLLQGLTGGSDRRHADMVNSQYR